MGVWSNVEGGVFLQRSCPDCGKPAIGYLECVDVFYRFPSEGAEQPLDYDKCETTVLWETGEPRQDETGKILLSCGEHEWHSEVVFPEIAAG